MVRQFQFLLFVAIFATRIAALAQAPAAPAPPSPRPPNFLILLADDLGYSDLGCYGGEIQTPNLDRLANNGLRFTQFYNTGRCWPSRSALMTGHYPQQIRMDPPRGRLPGWARLLPHHLKPRGYRAYHSGKWHINGAPKVVADGGYDRSYLIRDEDRNFNPRAHLEDDKPLPAIPPGTGYYTTTEYASRLIGYLRQHAAEHPDKPFLAYLAFTVPHFPLHAPASDIERIADRYVPGWDRIRAQRARRVRQMGLVTVDPGPLEPGIFPYWNLTQPRLETEIDPAELGAALPWDSLSQDQKRFQARKMAVHAAMIERMDLEIGRVLEQIQQMGAISNTVTLFASDNGASAEIINRGDKHASNAVPGSAASYLCLGPGWSSAANTPFRLHKSWTHEGGIATPLVVHWPAGIPERGALRHTPAHLVDIVPTLLELAGAGSILPASAPPLAGRSLVPAFAAEVTVARDPLYFHHDHNRALRIGDWKIVTRRPATNDWALYNLATDRAEQSDLAGREPERTRRMVAEWERLTAQFAKDAESSP